MPRTKTQTTDLSSIASRAMLVRLRINRWGAKKNDSAGAEQIAKSRNADPKLVKATKLLLASEALDKHRKCARHARRVHKFYTMPWDEGVGLLPANLFFKYNEDVGKLIREADGYAQEFVDEYTQQWNNGLSVYRKDLGSGFNAGDYPEPNRIKSKFGITIKTYPIENPDDFRVNLSEDVVSKVKKQIEDNYKSSIGEAMTQPILRLQEVIQHVKDKLADNDAIFRDSLIGNVEKLVEIMPDLNVTGDPKITAIIEKADKEICSVQDVKALRTDPAYRKQVAKSADAILKSMKGYV